MFGLVFTALAATSLATPHFPVARQENPSSSVFVHNTGSGSLVFAAVVARDAGSFFFHLEAPAEYSWVSVGTGEKMDGSLMWVAYRSSSGTGVTLSPRYSDDQVEPSYDAKIDCQISTENGATNGVINANDRDILVVNGVCNNITNSNPGQSKGTIDPSSTHQNFIFGLGPTGKDINSDSQSAGIRRHKLYGKFSMDLSKATVANADGIDEVHLGSVGNWIASNAQLVGGVESDFDWAGPVHALLLGGAFVILFPVGVVFLRLLEKVKWHAWMQSISVIIALLGVGVGVYLGREYNHTKDVNTAHQIVGLLVVLFVLVQLGLGMFHHRLYKRHQRPTLYGRVHLYLGPVVLIVGAINGFLGFSLGGEDKHNIWYGVVVGVVFVTLVAALLWARRRRRTKVARLERGFSPPRPYVHANDFGEAQGTIPLRNRQGR